METEFICEFCNSKFSKKCNLTTHQKRTKKCLLIQGKYDNNNNELFMCKKCDKSFTKKQSLNEHEPKCLSSFGSKYEDLQKKYEILEKTNKIKLEEKDKLIETLQRQVYDLQDKLSNIAEIGTKKETNTYRINNVVNQLVPYDLDRDKIRMIVDEKFTENHLYAKENGVVNFAVTNLLKDNEGNLKMTCTDTARKIFVYKDQDGNLYKDPNATNFTEMYIPEVKRKSYEIISDKEDDDVVELTECVVSIEPTNIANRLANKLVSKPKN